MSDELRAKIFEALGEASMCWVNQEREPEAPLGIFDSSHAEWIGNELVAAIDAEIANFKAKLFDYQTENLKFAAADAKRVSEIADLRAQVEAQAKEIARQNDYAEQQSRTLAMLNNEALGLRTQLADAEKKITLAEIEQK